MTIDQFTNKADGLINDFTGAISTEKEFRDGILDLLLLLCKESNESNERIEYLEKCADARSECRHYLMGVQDSELTTSDALEALGYGRDGVRYHFE